MFDWIGSLSIRAQESRRVVLGLSSVTRWAGAVLALVGAYGAWKLWPIAPVAAAVPMAVGTLGLLVATLERTLIFDRDAGTVRLRQGLLGLTTENVVPLFHLRAVVVMARPAAGLGTARFVAYLDRRVGDSIFLEDAKRCARLLRMAEAIAEVAELRLEYDAASVG